MIEPTSSLQAMPFRILLDEGMRWFRRCFARAYLPVAVPMALLQGVVAMLQLLGMRSIWSAAGNATGGPNFEDPSQMLPLMLWSIGLGLALSACSVVGLTALSAAAVTAVRGGEVRGGKAWQFAFAPRVLGTQVLVSLAIGAAMLLCCFPVLYVGPALGFVVPIMMEEGIFGGAAMSRSVELARYNPKRRFLDTPMVKVLVVGLIGAALSYALTLVVQLPLSAFQQFMVMREVVDKQDPTAFASTGWLWLNLPSQMLGSLVNTAVALYLFLAIALLYRDTRKRREAVDLERAIEDLVQGAGGDAEGA